MNHTYTTYILTQLKHAGYTVSKCQKENEWQVTDGTCTDSDIIVRSRALGDVAMKCAKQFNLKWEK